MCNCSEALCLSHSPQKEQPASWLLMFYQVLQSTHARMAQTRLADYRATHGQLAEQHPKMQNLYWWNDIRSIRINKYINLIFLKYPLEKNASMHII